MAVIRRPPDVRIGVLNRSGLVEAHVFRGIRAAERGAVREDGYAMSRPGKAQSGGLMVYIIAEPCIDVKDKSCVEECPVDCIYEGERMLYIQPDECIDCAACEPVCPVDAISYEDDLPEEWAQFQALNAEFFSEEVTGLGEPGGAATVGPVAKDHPTVASWDAPSA